MTQETNVQEVRSEVITYIQLMEEVKARIALLNILVPEGRPVNGVLAYEMCFLQLRMMCEIIAIACLLAHGDIPATRSKKMRESWEINKILACLSELRPEFFPIPLTGPTKTETGWHYGSREPDYLTQNELPRLHGRTGEILHKGGLASAIEILSFKRHNDFEEIKHWAQRISNLLSIHRMIIRDGEEVYICSLADGPEQQVRMMLGSRQPNQ